MYSYEDQIKAIALYIRNNLRLTDTVRMLGYPNKRMLRRWYKEYWETGNLHERYYP